MKRDRHEYLTKENDAERLSYGELAEIEDAFSTIPPERYAQRGTPDQAMASDMLEEIEAHGLTQ